MLVLTIFKREDVIELKKTIIFMIILSLLLLTACNGSKTGEAAEVVKKGAGYKIGIVTPTLSASEDEFRAGQNMVEKYPGIVKHISLPENFTAEVETGVSQIVSLADDPEMKAIIVAAGYSGLITGLQQVKDQRPDILTITAPIWDDPDMMADYIDINLDTDWGRRGITIAEKAKKWGLRLLYITLSLPI